ncbi:MAG: zf-TFIIB domain-containing protein [Planctomycetota bacterium]|nr:zf-TFIIB domain-containing protein [Planctomycetota bacterium]
MAIGGSFYAPLGGNSSFKPHDPFACSKGPAHGPPPAKAHDNEHLKPEGQRACPICGQTMDVQHYGLLKIDVCAAHGVWLDKGELRAVGLTRKRRGFHKHLRRVRRPEDVKEAGKWWPLNHLLDLCERFAAKRPRRR